MNKSKVYESYDEIFAWFDKARSRELFEKPYLDLAISYLKPKAKILDIGCGMGEPIAQYFINKCYQLTGIDGSYELINLAKSRFPKAEFVTHDMRTIDLKEKFDLIIAWHSLFHLSQEEQSLMFEVFENHITKEGVLLFTTGDKKGEVWSDNGGKALYHASLDAEEYKELLLKHSFDIIKHTMQDESCGGATVWMAIHK